MAAVRIFISYSHKDEEPKEDLLRHLKPLEIEGKISIWHDRKIVPGQNWNDSISSNIDQADLVILLVSVDFINSQYCYSNEMRRALDLESKNVLKIVPVILGEVDWHGQIFAKFNVLPSRGIPVTDQSWQNTDEAMANVARGIRAALQTLNKFKRSTLAKSGPSDVKFEVEYRSLGGWNPASSRIIRTTFRLEDYHYIDTGILQGWNTEIRVSIDGIERFRQKISFFQFADVHHEFDIERTRCSFIFKPARHALLLRHFSSVELWVLNERIMRQTIK